MCLSKAHIFPKISFKPIEVVKVLKILNYHQRLQDENCTPEYVTPFEGCPVTLNSTLKAKRHWLSSLFDKLVTGQGVHAYTIPEKIGLDKDEVMIKAFIPRFTFYWEDENRLDIAATSLYITDEDVTLPECYI